MVNYCDYLFLFFLSRHDGTDSPPNAEDVIVVLNSFHSKIIKVRVRKFLRHVLYLTSLLLFFL